MADYCTVEDHLTRGGTRIDSVRFEVKDGNVCYDGPPDMVLAAVRSDHRSKWYVDRCQLDIINHRLEGILTKDIPSPPKKTKRKEKNANDSRSR